MLDVCLLCCFSTFLLEVLPHIHFFLCLLFEDLFDLSSEFLFYAKSLSLGVFDVIFRIIDALRSELEDMEVVDLPLFDVQLNDSVSKMSF